ncbi:MAG TPA: hypothetical protein VFA20_06940 [Myxococcaceae bacterium]|nr:hypothetical protein [Myxococcaceae bacterium]
MSPDDRRHFAHLGLTVLVIGLVVAPLSHLLIDHAGAQIAADEAWLTHGTTAGHTHSHPHSHDRSAHHHTHPPDSIQHLTALFAPVSLQAPSVVLEQVAEAVVRAPASKPRVATWVHPAMPQGP